MPASRAPVGTGFQPIAAFLREQQQVPPRGLKRLVGMTILNRVSYCTNSAVLRKS